jgi:hypothetical protein
MWQSQAFGGALSFGGSVPDDHGATRRASAAATPLPPAAMIVAPGNRKNSAYQTRRVPERFKVVDAIAAMFGATILAMSARRTGNSSVSNQGLRVSQALFRHEG